MAKHNITLIPGDGIGPEIVAATVRVLEASGAEIEWETHIIGAQALEKFGATIPETTIESIKRNRVALKGPLSNDPRVRESLQRRLLSEEHSKRILGSASPQPSVHP